MADAMLVYESDGSARIYSRYDMLFVESLKRAIPPPMRRPMRRWYAEEKYWWINEAAIPDAKRLLAEFYDGYQERRTQNTQPRQSEDAYSLLGVRSDADPDVIDAAYRVLAKKHHPDRGGNPEMMKRINLAYEEIRKRVRRA